jgi:hypothetical protein
MCSWIFDPTSLHSMNIRLFHEADAMESASGPPLASRGSSTGSAVRWCRKSVGTRKSVGMPPSSIGPASRTGEVLGWPAGRVTSPWSTASAVRACGSRSSRRQSEWPSRRWSGGAEPGRAGPLDRCLRRLVCTAALSSFCLPRLLEYGRWRRLRCCR